MVNLFPKRIYVFIEFPKRKFTKDASLNERLLKIPLKIETFAFKFSPFSNRFPISFSHKVSRQFEVSMILHAGVFVDKFARFCYVLWWTRREYLQILFRLINRVNRRRELGREHGNWHGTSARFTLPRSGIGMIHRRCLNCLISPSESRQKFRFAACRWSSKLNHAWFTRNFTVFSRGECLATCFVVRNCSNPLFVQKIFQTSILPGN